MTKTTDFERDVRLNLMDSLLSAAQRDSAALSQLHRDALELDAQFYGHLACWFHTHGQVRTFKEMFVAGLFASALDIHRQAAWVLLQDLAPHQVENVVKLSKQCFQKTPRSLKSAVENYLRHREAKPQGFDRAAVRQGKALKSLYASLHIRPSERAQSILFQRQPPEGSLSWQVKQLARCQTAAEQARRIVELRLPFPIAVGVLKALTPATLAALLEVMTPAEVMNHMKMLREKGAFEHPELRARIEEKLTEAKTDVRVSDFRSLQAVKAVGGDAKLAEQLESVNQTRVQARGSIVRSTAILVDKSGSMDQAIKIGVQLAALTAGLMKAPLHVLVFDSLAWPIQAQGSQTVADWERAFQGITAAGATAIGAGVAVLRKNGTAVEQLVVITDEEENTAPYFTNELALYEKQFGYAPQVLLLKVQGASEHLERALRQSGRAFDTYQFTGDYFSLPNLIPMLTRPGRFELLLEILSTPLPVRPIIATQAG
jgi:hypothetical protein